MNDQALGAHFLEDALKSFRDYKKLAERAFEQVDESDLFRTIDDESNSIGVNMKHMAGNMLSRWTDFLTSDGEKPNRERDLEFVILPDTTKAAMVAYWEKGWQRVFDAVEPLTAADLMRIVKIRGQDHTVVQAINRQIVHYAYHVGQIVYLAKHFKSSDWQNLSVPKNKSAEFNNYLEEKIKSGASAGEGRFDAVVDFGVKNPK
jgi:sulfur carrier protein ThiS